MSKFREFSEHVSVDTITQKTTRSSVLGVISLGKQAIVVESGNPLEVGIKFRKELDAYLNIPLKYLFLTHAHSDHRGGMNAFIDTTLIISKKCKQNLPKSVNLNKWEVTIFENRLTLEEDIKVEFYHVGGHSLGSSVAYVPDEKILFAGDLFFTEPINFGIPFLGFYQNNPRKTGNPEECLAAFKKFQSMKLRYIVPGHGEVVENPMEYLQEQIEFYNELKKFIISEIDKGKEIEVIEIPRIGQIEKAYKIIDTKDRKSKDLQFMKTIQDWLKKSFYNYYKDK